MILSVTDRVRSVDRTDSERIVSVMDTKQRIEKGHGRICSIYRTRFRNGQDRDRFVSALDS